MKKFFVYLLFLIPWFFSGLLFKVDIDFYKSLTLPTFTPPQWLFGIIWTIIYILTSYTVYKIWIQYGKNDQTKPYYTILIANYIFNQLFTFGFFIVKSTFLGFLLAFSTFISCFWLYFETYILNKKISRYLLPYLIWSFLASILALSIFLLNT